MKQLNINEDKDKLENERLNEEMRNKFQIDNKKIDNNLKISLQRMEDKRRIDEKKEDNRHDERNRELDNERLKIEKDALNEQHRIENEMQQRQLNHEQTIKTMDHNHEKEMEQLKAGFKDNEMENKMKMDLELSFFLDQIEKIYNNLETIKSSTTISKESTSQANGDGSGELLTAA